MKSIKVPQCFNEKRSYFDPVQHDLRVLADRIAAIVNGVTHRQLGKLDADTICEYLRFEYVPPTCLVTSLLLIKRFEAMDPTPYLTKEITSTELLVVSMLIASKYLYDDDTEFGVWNQEWAERFHMDVHDLNRLEVQFLHAMNWHIFISQREFMDFLPKICYSYGPEDEEPLSQLPFRRRHHQHMHFSRKSKRYAMLATAKVATVVAAACLTISSTTSPPFRLLAPATLFRGVPMSSVMNASDISEMDTSTTAESVVPHHCPLSYLRPIGVAQAAVMCSCVTNADWSPPSFACKPTHPTISVVKLASRKVVCAG